MTFTDRHGKPLNWHRTVCCDWEAYDHQQYGVHYHDLDGNRLDPTLVTPSTVQKAPTGDRFHAGPAVRYVWHEFLALCRITGMAPTTSDVECCHCHRVVSPGQAWSAVAVDHNGKPRSGFLHCGQCRIRLGAGTAWQTAQSETVKPDIRSASIRG